MSPLGGHRGGFLPVLIEGNLGKHISRHCGCWMSERGAHKWEKGCQGIWVEDPIVH